MLREVFGAPQEYLRGEKRRKPKGEKDMNKERENIDISHTPPHVCAHARVYGTPGTTLQHSRSSPFSVPTACWHCRFFEPSDPSSLEKPWTDETLPGECRLLPPQIGDLIKRGTDDEERWFGNFPRVMAGDWCGQFQPREPQLR